MKGNTLGIYYFLEKDSEITFYLLKKRGNIDLLRVIFGFISL